MISAAKKAGAKWPTVAQMQAHIAGLIEKQNLIYSLVPIRAAQASYELEEVWIPPIKSSGSMQWLSMRLGIFVAVIGPAGIAWLESATPGHGPKLTRLFGQRPWKGITSRPSPGTKRGSRLAP
jgi:hypothetical protein